LNLTLAISDNNLTRECVINGRKNLLCEGTLPPSGLQRIDAAALPRGNQIEATLFGLKPQRE
jgi:hypothetical protein